MERLSRGRSAAEDQERVALGLGAPPLEAQPPCESQGMGRSAVRRWLRRGCALVAVALIAPLGVEAALQAHLAWRRRANEAYRRLLARDELVARAETEGVWKERWYSYLPHASARAPALGLTLTTNSRGYRTPEFADAPAPGLLRVVALGGSTTLGGWTDQDTWPRRCQEALDAARPGRFEVLNLGVSGADLAATRRRVETELMGLHPHALVIYHGVNCIRGRRQLIWPDHPGLAKALDRFEVVDRLTRPWRSRELFLSGVSDQLRHLDAISRWCRARGVRLFVCTFAIPRREHFDPQRWEALSLHARRFWIGRDIETYQWSLEQWNWFLRAWAGASPPPFVLLDLEPALQGDFFEDPCHLEARGLALQGQLVARELLAAWE